MPCSRIFFSTRGQAVVPAAKNGRWEDPHLAHIALVREGEKNTCLMFSS